MNKTAVNTNIIHTAEGSHSLPGMIRIFSELVKFRITALVSFTTGLGFILAANEINVTLLFAIAGIFLLASASSALNHWQERNTDALMERTKHRPIPSGKISSDTALFVSMGLLASGSLLLLLTTNFTTFAVGLFTFLWYNGIYTPLKMKSAFAILPGALVGALPPVAGWTAAGGDLLSPSIIAVAVYFFIWQIPHFWLLLMIYGSDYQKGGFPTLDKIFSREQLKRITFMWLVGNVFTAMMLPLFVNINYSISIALLGLISLWMLVVSVKFFRSEAERIDIRNTFISINFYTLLLITILSFDKLIKVF